MQDSNHENITKQHLPELYLQILNHTKHTHTHLPSTKTQTMLRSFHSKIPSSLKTNIFLSTFATQTQRPAPRLNTFHNSNKNNRHGTNKPKLTKFKSPVKYRLLLDTRATLAALKQSLQVVENVSKEGGNILLVSTNKNHRSLLFDWGKVTGQPFFLRWTSGTLTNWVTFADNVDRFGDKLNLRKETLLDWQRTKAVTEFLRKKQGVLTQKNKPDLIIYLNPEQLPRSLGEAYAMRIPTVGLCNTSGNPHTLTYPIPANDQSVEVVSLFVQLIKTAVVTGKKKGAVVRKKQALIANAAQRDEAAVLGSGNKWGSGSQKKQGGGNNGNNQKGPKKFYSKKQRDSNK